MAQIHIHFFKHQYAEFIIGSYKSKICICDFRYRKKRNVIDKRIQASLNTTFVEKSDALIEQTKSQLTQYFMGERQQFNIPIQMVGNHFQQSVWHALAKIPYGEVSTYSNLAEQLSTTYSIENVAKANGENALAIIVPCHRIIDPMGSIIGYGGGLELKKRLLELEHSLFS